MLNLVTDKNIVGDFNQAPPSFQELSEGEFAVSNFFNYRPAHTEYRQITDKNVLKKLNIDSYLSITMFWFHDGTGVAMSSDFCKQRVRYFSFMLCRHSYIITKTSNCYSEMVCKKCSYNKFIDSSD